MPTIPYKQLVDENNEEFYPVCGESSLPTVPIDKGGTGATTASNACANLGAIPSILTSDYYGDTLPSAGTPGRIFFLKVE